MTFKEYLGSILWAGWFIAVGFVGCLMFLGIQGKVDIYITPPQLSISQNDSNYDILGEYYYSADKIIIYPGRSSSGNGLLDTMYHEYCHYLIDDDNDMHFCNNKTCKDIK